MRDGEDTPLHARGDATHPHARYADAFTGQAAADGSRAAKALAFAHDARKFEIELYWKRATYFWAFCAVAVGAWVAILGAKELENKPQALLLVACLGQVFSVAWYLVNRASKYWQLNWELHVDMLEDAVTGPIYKTVLHDRPSLFRPDAAYPFSVSKINQLLSLFVVLVFAALLADTVHRHFQLTRDWEFLPTACLLMTAGCVASFVWLGRVSPNQVTASAWLRRTMLGSLEQTRR